MAKEKLRLIVERGRHGLWYVTSPDVKGLIIAAGGRGAAIRYTPGELLRLERAQKRIGKSRK